MRPSPLLLLLLTFACGSTLAPERPRPLPFLDFARLAGDGRSPRDSPSPIAPAPRRESRVGPVTLAAPRGVIVDAPWPAPLDLGSVTVVRRRGTRRDGAYVALRSDPSGAEVFFGERHLGRTPLLLFVRSDARAPLRLTLPGHVPAAVPLPHRGRPTLEVHLRRENRSPSDPCAHRGSLIPCRPVSR